MYKITAPHWLKKLFCRHDYKQTESFCLDDTSPRRGLEVVRGYVCRKWDKEILQFVVGKIEFK